MAATFEQQTIINAQQPNVVHNVNPGQHQTVVLAQQPAHVLPTNVDPRPKHKKVLVGLGIAECVLGVISIVLAIAVIGIASDKLNQYNHEMRYVYFRRSSSSYFRRYVLPYSSQGIWGGIFKIVTGILGIRVKYTSSRCMYIANMTMAIITALISFSGTVLSGIAAAILFYKEEFIALYATLSVISFAAMVITIIHSAFCCSGVCCRSDSVPTQHVGYYPQQHVVQPQPQYVQGPNGQLFMVVNQPVIPQPNYQTSTFQQTSQSPATISAVTVATSTPTPTTLAHEGTCENMAGKAPPAYEQGV